MKTITLENEVKFIVADSIAHIFIEHLTNMAISFKIFDTTAGDINKTNYSGVPNFISDFNHLSD